MILSHDIIVRFGLFEYYYDITNAIWFNVDFGIIKSKTLLELSSIVETLHNDYNKSYD